MQTWYDWQTHHKLELAGAVVMGSLPGCLGTGHVRVLCSSTCHVPERMRAESTVRYSRQVT